MNKEKLTELVYINLGRASMCWSEIPKGVFDSTKAAELGKEIMEAIDEYVETQETIEDLLERYNNPETQEKLMKLRDKEERKFKLDDSFKKRMEKVVVSDTPAYSWMDEYRKEYDAALTSGMFFEWFPTFTGEWDKDKYAFCHDRKYKKLSPQDPAPHSNKDITINDIHRIAKEMFEEETLDDILEIEETDEEAAYRKGYMDGYDEGLYDGQYK